VIVEPEPVVIEPEDLPPPVLTPVLTPVEFWLPFHQVNNPKVQVYGTDGIEFFVDGALDGVDLSQMSRLYREAQTDILSVREKAELADARLWSIVILREPDCNDGGGFRMGITCATGNAGYAHGIEVLKTRVTSLRHEWRHKIYGATPVLRDEICPNPKYRVSQCIGHSIFPKQIDCAACDPLK
jgi:hypothetical protein